MNSSHQQQPAGCGHGVHLGWSWIPIALAVTLSVLLWQGHRVHLLAAIPISDPALLSTDAPLAQARPQASG